IVGFLPVMRQTLFFSATLSEEIHTIGRKFVMNPKLIEVAKPASTADTISQNLVRTTFKKKREALRDLLRSQDIQNAVIFCNRKRDISTLLSSMKRHGFSATGLHGDMTQSARLAALDEFKNGQIPLLVASDVAARGLDIPSVSHVFNFDVPSNAEDYVHRIGRTGRAGRHGHAFTLIAGEDDEKAILAIEKLTGQPIPVLSNTDRQSKKEHSTDDAGKSAKKYRESRTLSKTASNQLGQEEKNPGGGDKGPSRRSEQGEKRPPAWKGNSFKDSDHIPAFLR
ncbi:MAG: helicase-related protein, partial [Candidatus Puniceispirillaceae bacterium]